jgi:hypothetical protein
LNIYYFVLIAAAGIVSLENGFIQGNNENAAADIIVGIACVEDEHITPCGVWYKSQGVQSSSGPPHALALIPTVTVQFFSITFLQGKCTESVI